MVSNCGFSRTCLFNVNFDKQRFIENSPHKATISNPRYFDILIKYFRMNKPEIFTEFVVLSLFYHPFELLNSDIPNWLHSKNVECKNVRIYNSIWIEWIRKINMRKWTFNWINAFRYLLIISTFHIRFNWSIPWKIWWIFQINFPQKEIQICSQRLIYMRDNYIIF